MSPLFFLFLMIFIAFPGPGVAGECPLDAKGRIIPVLGYDIASVKNSANKEIYQLIPNSENPYGGSSLIWAVTKDQQGRVVRIESGGERPSQKQIAFELKKNQELFTQKNLLKKSATSFSLPDADSFKLALGRSEDFPFKFGTVIEMAHTGSSCRVIRLADRLYDHKLQRTLERNFFSVDRCVSISNLYKKFFKDISECSEKYKLHELEIAAISNDSTIIGNITSGVGGGGGAPIRSIASLMESDREAVFQSTLEVEQALCGRLAPTNRPESHKPSSSSSTRQ
jgi:hypothetical protein